MWVFDYQYFPILLWFLAGLGVSLALGWGLTRARPRRERIDNLLLLLAPASIYVMGIKAAMGINFAPQVDWSAGRFSPTYSLLRGFTLYYPVDSGPIYDTIYPPMSYLAYFPAALLPGPTEALMGATALSQLMVLLPVLALCFAPHGDRGSFRSPLFATFVFLGFWKLAATTVMSAMLTMIHADAPSVCFGALACAVLYARRGEATPSARTMISSAVFAALAVWSKQALAPVLALLPVWMFLTNGFKDAARFVAYMGATVAAISGVFVAAFGLKPMMFNIMQVPKSHPWMYAPQYSHGFLVYFTEMMAVSLPVLIGLLALAYLVPRFWREVEGETEAEVGAEPTARPGRFEAIRAYLRGNYWVLFAAMAAATVPIGLLGRIKVGGHLNSYLHPLYFLALAPCVLLLDWYARNRERGRDQANVALKVMVLVWPLSPLFLLNTDLLKESTTMVAAHNNPQELAYRYALKHPGEAYFPWNTLSTLMAEGKAYHFEAGMIDRAMGHFEPSNEHLRRYVPENVKLVAYPPSPIVEWTMRYFPEFKRRVVIEELPGWICYER